MPKTFRRPATPACSASAFIKKKHTQLEISRRKKKKLCSSHVEFQHALQRRDRSPLMFGPRPLNRPTTTTPGLVCVYVHERARHTPHTKRKNIFSTIGGWQKLMSRLTHVMSPGATDFLSAQSHCALTVKTLWFCACRQLTDCWWLWWIAP